MTRWHPLNSRPAGSGAALLFGLSRSRALSLSLCRALSLSLCLALLTARALAEPPASPTAPVVSEAPTRSDVGAGISAGRIQEDVNVLASPTLGGRGLGTAGLELAGDYLARQLLLARVPGVGPLGSYFQPFDISTEVRLGTVNLLEVQSGSKPTALTLGTSFTPLGFSESARVEGDLVFAGYGISAADLPYDDYAGLEVKDRIVVVLRGLPGGKASGPFEVSGGERFAQLRYKAMVARDKGARAILLVDREDGGSLMPLPRGQVTSSAGIVALHLGRSEAVSLLKQGGLDLEEVQRQLDGQLKAASRPLKGLRVTTEVTLDKQVGMARNVIGVLEGSDPVLKDEVVIIGAHYDHLGLGGESSLAPDKLGTAHVGADDNASGTAGMLELARVFGATGLRPKRTLVFIGFSAEEAGLGGSAHYTRQPLFPLEKTVLMINMDMIGRLRDNKVQIQGVDTATGLRELLEPLVAEAGLKASYSGDGYGPSDHTPFYARGIPVLFFFTGAHADYHRPSDTAEKLNAEGEAGILRLVAAVVERVANAPGRPEYVRLSSAPPPQEGGGGGRGGYGAYLGTIPDFTESEGGVLLTGVRPGSPAEQAGIQGGDKIVQLGDRKVLNLQDFTYVLRDHRPGDRVTVVLERAGQRLTVQATLGKRQ